MRTEEERHLARQGKDGKKKKGKKLVEIFAEEKPEPKPDKDKAKG